MNVYFQAMESTKSNKYIFIVQFYDDTELDVVVITEADGIPDDPQIKRPPAPSSSKGSKIPKRRNSTKRPAVSLKSSGFFSQSVA